MEWALEVSNLVATIRKPAKPDGRLRLLRKEEARYLLEVCKTSRNTKLYPFVQLMLHTGMRPSEGAGLLWGQVDIDGRIIDLTVTKTKPRRVTIKAIEIRAEIMPEKVRQKAAGFPAARQFFNGFAPTEPVLPSSFRQCP